MSSGAAIRAVDTAVGLALQADARRATDALHAVAGEAFTGEEARFRAAMLDPFDRGEPLAVPAESGDELVDAVVEAFRTYWWHALTAPHATDAHFSEMEAWELEYRAKLVELVQAVETRGRILGKLGESQWR